MAHVTFPKPSRLARDVARHKKRTATAKARRTRQRQARRDFAKKRVEAYVRDQGRCRAFGTPLKLASENPLLVAHCHHVTFRSAGGSDESSNLATLSPVAHEMVHRHELDIAGDADVVLTFTEHDPETGRVVRAWESWA